MSCPPSPSLQDLRGASSSENEKAQLQKNRVGCTRAKTYTGANKEGRCKALHAPPCVEQCSSGKRPLLASEASAGVGEEYSNDERQLNEFLKLHPMCSLESSSARVLQIVQQLFSETASVATPTVPVVPKSYDDTMLRPALTSIGERECICGAQCLCTVLAKVRYGNETDFAFVCTEFLLPQERCTFLQTGQLPEQRKKCLVCSRYYQNYVYILARSDAHFTLSRPHLSTQTFANEHAAPPALAKGRADDLPRSAAMCQSIDGYVPEAMLFVDEEFANTRLAREGPMGVLLWQPVVRFSSRHYRYKRSADGTPLLVQVGIGMQDRDFWEPPSTSVGSTEASFMRPTDVDF